LHSRFRGGTAFIVWLAAASAAQTEATTSCPAPMPTVVLERFISADCETCWSSGPAQGDGKNAPFVLDWIVPSERGDAAPLSVAALVEAGVRAPGVSADGTASRRHAIARPGAMRVTVGDGPAWNGYIGLRLSVAHKGGAWPVGAVGYLALVERVPAGQDGTPVPRQLVRTLVGPLVLDELRTQRQIAHLRAVRVPENGKAERLVGVGWVQAADGRMLALGAAKRDNCGPP
jgi:hypothetical protein